MKRIIKKKIDYTDWTEEQHVEHLRTYPPYLVEYEKYDPVSVERFIPIYAQKKHVILNDKEWYKEDYEEHQTWSLTLAERYIDMILQKKLFNLQCQWHAELIRLPLVMISSDFRYWEKNIRSCPFIPPITQEELDVFIAYLKDQIDLSEDEEEDYPNDWQSYKNFKNQLLVNKYEEDIEKILPPIKMPHSFECKHLPNLYTFFDEHQGTEALINLPDVRGDKRKIYLDEYMRLFRESQAKEYEANMATNPPRPVYKPSIYASNYELPKFIDEVEDDDVRETFKYYFEYEKRQDDYADEDYEFLKSIEEPIQMIGDEDWRMSMKLSVLWYKQCKSVEVLPYVYETYLMEFDEDVPVEELIEERSARYKFNMEGNAYRSMNIYRNHLLEGRESLTGKKDFNF